MPIRYRTYADAVSARNNSYSPALRARIRIVAATFTVCGETVRAGYIHVLCAS